MFIFFYSLLVIFIVKRRGYLHLKEFNVMENAGTSVKLCESL